MSKRARARVDVDRNVPPRRRRTFLECFSARSSVRVETLKRGDLRPGPASGQRTGVARSAKSLYANLLTAKSSLLSLVEELPAPTLHILRETEGWDLQSSRMRDWRTGPPQLHEGTSDLDLRDSRESPNQANMRTPSEEGASGPDHFARQT